MVLYALFYVFLVLFIFFDSFKQESNKLELSGKEERKLGNAEKPEKSGYSENSDNSEKSEKEEKSEKKPARGDTPRRNKQRGNKKPTDTSKNE